MLEIHEAEYSRTIMQDDAIVIVDFYGNGCAPCRQIIPLLEWAERNYPQLRFFKLNLSASHENFAHFHICAVPTIIFFWQGNEIERVVGTVTKVSFIKHIEKALKYSGI